MAEEKFFEYKIKPGDTAWRLAQRFQTNLESLKRLNPEIPDLSKIYPDRILKIPLLSPEKAPEEYKIAAETGVKDLFAGKFGQEGAREKLIGTLKEKFPHIDVASDIYTRVPDYWEKEIKLEEKITRPLQNPVREAAFSFLKFTPSIPSPGEIFKKAQDWVITQIIKPVKPKIEKYVKRLKELPDFIREAVEEPSPLGKALQEKIASFDKKMEETEEKLREKPPFSWVCKPSPPDFLEKVETVEKEIVEKGLKPEQADLSKPEVAYTFNVIETRYITDVLKPEAEELGFVFNPDGSFNREKTNEQISTRIRQYEGKLGLDVLRSEGALSQLEYMENLAALYDKLRMTARDIQAFITNPKNLTTEGLKKFGQLWEERLGKTDLRLLDPNLRSYEEILAQHERSLTRAEDYFALKVPKWEEEFFKYWDPKTEKYRDPEIQTYFELEAKPEKTAEDLAKAAEIAKRKEQLLLRIIELRNLLRPAIIFGQVNEALADLVGNSEVWQGIYEMLKTQPKPDEKALEALVKVMEGSKWLREHNEDLKKGFVGKYAEAKTVEDFENLAKEVRAARGISEGTRKAWLDLLAYNANVLKFSEELTSAYGRLQTYAKAYREAMYREGLTQYEDQKRKYDQIEKNTLWQNLKTAEAWKLVIGGWVEKIMSTPLPLPCFTVDVPLLPKEKWRIKDFRVAKVNDVLHGWNLYFDEVVIKRGVPAALTALTALVETMNYRGEKGSLLAHIPWIQARALKERDQRTYLAIKEIMNLDPSLYLPEGMSIAEAARTSKLITYLGKVYDFYRNPASYETITVDEDTRIKWNPIKGIITIGPYTFDTLSSPEQLYTLNPHLKDSRIIKKGTTIQIPRFHTGPHLTDFINPDLRYRFYKEAKPVAWTIDNIFPIFLDPLTYNLVWSKISEATIHTAKFFPRLGVKTASKVVSAAGRLEWMKRHQKLLDLGEAFVEIASGKRIHPSEWPFMQKWNTPVSKVFTAFWREKVLRMGTPLEFQAIMAHGSTEMMKSVNRQFVSMEVQKALAEVAKKYGRLDDLEEAFYAYIKTGSTRHEGVIEVLRTLSLTSDDLYKLVDNYPFLEDWKVTFEKMAFSKERLARQREMAYRLKYQRLSPTGKDFFDAVLNARIPRYDREGRLINEIVTPEDYFKFKQRYISRIDPVLRAQEIPKIREAEKLLREYIRLTEATRKLIEATKQVAEVPQGMVINSVKLKGPEATALYRRVSPYLEKGRYMTDVVKGKQRLIFFPDRYKGREPVVLEDVFGVRIGGRRAFLEQTVYGSHGNQLPLSRVMVIGQRWNPREGKMVDIKKLVKGTKTDRMIDRTLGHALVTDFEFNLKPIWLREKPEMWRRISEILEKEFPEEARRIETRSVSIWNPDWNARLANAVEGKSYTPFGTREVSKVVEGYGHHAWLIEQIAILDAFKTPKNLLHLRYHHEILTRTPWEKLSPEHKIQKLLLDEYAIFDDQMRIVSYKKTLPTFSQILLISDTLSPSEFKTVKDFLNFALKHAASAGRKSYLRMVAPVKRESVKTITSMMDNKYLYRKLKQMKRTWSLLPEEYDLNRIIPAEFLYLPAEPIWIVKGRGPEEAIGLAREKAVSDLTNILKEQEKLSVETLKPWFRKLDKVDEKIRNSEVGILTTMDQPGKLTAEEEKILAALGSKYIIRVADVTPKDKAIIKFLKANKNKLFYKIHEPLKAKELVPTKAELIKKIKAHPFYSKANPNGVFTDEGFLKVLAYAVEPSFGYTGTSFPFIPEKWDLFVKVVNSELMKTPTGKTLRKTMMKHEMGIKERAQLKWPGIKTGEIIENIDAQLPGLPAAVRENIARMARAREYLPESFHLEKKEAPFLQEIYEDFNNWALAILHDLRASGLELRFKKGKLVSVILKKKNLTGIPTIQEEIILATHGNVWGNLTTETRRILSKQLPTEIRINSKGFLDRSASIGQSYAFSNLFDFKDFLAQARSYPWIKQRIEGLSKKIEPLARQIEKERRIIARLEHQLKIEVPAPVITVKPNCPPLLYKRISGKSVDVVRKYLEKFPKFKKYVSISEIKPPLPKELPSRRTRLAALENRLKRLGSEFRRLTQKLKDQEDSLSSILKDKGIPEIRPLSSLQIEYLEILLGRKSLTRDFLTRLEAVIAELQTNIKSLNARIGKAKGDLKKELELLRDNSVEDMRIFDKIRNNLDTLALISRNKLTISEKELYAYSKGIVLESLKKKSQQLEKLVEETAKKAIKYPGVAERYQKLLNEIPELVENLPYRRLKDRSLPELTERFLSLEKPTQVFLTAETVPTAVAEMNNLLNSLRTRGVKTIVDLSGDCLAPPFSQLAKDFTIIDGRFLTKERLIRLSKRGGVPSDLEAQAMEKLGKIFYQHPDLILISPDIEWAKEVLRNFRENWLPPRTRKVVEAMKDLTAAQEALGRQKLSFPGPTYAYPRDIPKFIEIFDTDETLALSLTERLKPPEAVRAVWSKGQAESVFREFRYFLQKTGELPPKERLIVADLDKYVPVLVVGPDRPVVSRAYLTAMRDMVKKQNVKIYLPKKLNRSETTIASFLNSQKIPFQRIDLKPELFETTFPKNYPVYLYPVGGLKGVRKDFFNIAQRTNRVFKSLEKLKAEEINKIYQAFVDWYRKADRFAPEFIRQKVEHGLNLNVPLRPSRLEEILTDWLIFHRRKNFPEKFDALMELALKRGREDAIHTFKLLKWRPDAQMTWLPKEQRWKMVYKVWNSRLKKMVKVERFMSYEEFANRVDAILLTPLERKEIAKQIKRAEWSARAIRDLYEIGKKPTWFEKLREKIAERLDLIYLREANAYGLAGIPVEGLEKLAWSKTVMKFIADAGWKLPDAFRIVSSPFGLARSVWIRSVLYYPPRWHLKNTIDDGVRGMLAADSLEYFVKAQTLYTIATRHALANIIGDLGALPSRLFEVPEGVIEQIEKIAGPNWGRFLRRSLRKIKGRPYRVYDFHKALAERRKGILRALDKKLWERGGLADFIKFDEAVREHSLATPAGEWLTPGIFDHMCEAGLYQTASDEFYLSQIASLLPEHTFFQRAKKAFLMFDADIMLYSATHENLRRSLLIYDLVFKKGMRLAEAKAKVWGYLFNYRDLTLVGRMFRYFFPFYAFNANVVRLFFQLAIKEGPKAWWAARALIDGWNEAVQDLPEQYRDRIPVNIGGVTFLWYPWLSIWQILGFLKEPEEALRQMAENPLRTVLGFGWSPEMTTIVSRLTGKKYWDIGTELQLMTGWTKEQVDRELKALKIKRDKAEDKGFWYELLLTYCPLVPLVKRMSEVETHTLLDEVGLMRSKKLREWMKFFGLNVVKWDDPERFQWILFSSPPHLRKHIEKELTKENPDAMRLLKKMWATSVMIKAMNAPPEEAAKFRIRLQDQAFVNKYFELEEEQKGKGELWLQKNKTARQALDRFFQSLEMTPWRLLGRARHNLAELRSEVYAGASMVYPKEVLGRASILGIEYDCVIPGNKQEFLKEFIDERGHFMIATKEERDIILSKGWEEKFISKEKKRLQEAMEERARQRYHEWLYEKVKGLTKEEEELGWTPEQKKKFATKMSAWHAILPENIEDLSEKKAIPYWNAYWDYFERYFADDEKKIYYLSLEPWYARYREKIREYCHLWKGLIEKFEEEEFDFFGEFYQRPDWFQKLYFYKYPNKAIWYPFAKEWTGMLRRIQKAEKETGLFQRDLRKEASRYFWAPQNKGARLAWDRDNPGFLDYMTIWRKIFAETEGHPEKYFPLFYSQPDWFRERFFKKNPDKALYYPFIMKWIELIELDKKNAEAGKKTVLAKTWFWSKKNAKAREAYGRANMITKDKSKVDYLKIWQEVIELTEENPKKFFEFFDQQPEWFKKHYFETNPIKKRYYWFARELSKLPPEEWFKYFWREGAKYEEARKAWDEDKPGFLDYMRFWKKLSSLAETGNWEGYFNYYFAPKNEKYRLRHWRNHPEAKERFELFRKYVLMPSATWEDRRAKRQFLKTHPQLLEWWQEDLSETEAKIRMKVEEYYRFLDNIPANGRGKEYFLEFRKWKVLAKDFLEKNPEVLLFFQKRPRLHTGQKAEIFTLIESFEALTTPEEKREFLSAHPQLENYFFYSNPPGIRRILTLQKEYFALPESEKQAFLDVHPELIDWWEVSKLPKSYWTDPEKFRPYQEAISQVEKVMELYLNKKWVEAEKARTALPSFWKDPGDSDEDNWFRLKTYRIAMKTWVKLVDINEFFAIYFFRQLPDWIRTMYYQKHPEKQYLSKQPLSRFLEEPLRVWEAIHPELAWAYKMIYRYGKNMPAATFKKVRDIMERHGVWEERSKWTREQWQEFWRDRALKLNEVLEFDYQNLPLLKAETKRVERVFPLRLRPKPFGAPRIAVLHPFF